MRAWISSKVGRQGVAPPYEAITVPTPGHIVRACLAAPSVDKYSVTLPARDAASLTRSCNATETRDWVTYSAFRARFKIGPIKRWIARPKTKRRSQRLTQQHQMRRASKRPRVAESRHAGAIASPPRSQRKRATRRARVIVSILDVACRPTNASIVQVRKIFTGERASHSRTIGFASGRDRLRRDIAANKKGAATGALRHRA